MAEPGSVRLPQPRPRCEHPRLPRVAALMVAVLAPAAAALWWWR